MLFLDAFDRRDFERRTALIFLGRRLTYGEIAAEACRIASGLQSLGVHKGGRVGLYFRNCPQLLASLIACWRIGAVAVPIRRWQSAEMTISWCNYLGVACLLIDEALEEKLSPHLQELTSCRTVVSTAAQPSIPVQPWSTLITNDGHYRRTDFDAREPVLVLHTSGTTARPKAIAHSLRGLDDRARALLHHLPIEPRDVVCVFSDISHAFGLNVMAAPALAAGATVLLIPEFDPKVILGEMSKHSATVTGGAPGYLLGLLEEARRGSGLGKPKLRRALSSSDKAPENLHREWPEVMGITLLEGFGMTEACGTLFSNRPGDIGVGTVGRPLPGVRIRVVGTDGRDVADGAVGELWCAGEFLFTGYWNDPEATQRAVIDGWFRTGDQVVRDEHGRYRIVGRTGLMIKRGGIFVSPYEVEAALVRHPAVRECLAVGRPSERWGQEVEVFVVLQEPVSATDLQAYAARALGEPSRPTRYWSVPGIGRTAAGKIARSDIDKLRAAASLLSEHK
jgi:acyl-CoA synthetase (AMP-forming)/AMP-acid ligase II